MYTIMSYLTVGQVRTLGSTSSTTALTAIDCIVSVYRAHGDTPSWRLTYPLFTRAIYAADAATSTTLQQLPFIAHLSRACRACGKRTQRHVFGVLLCSVCTRNHHLIHAWMVPARVAEAFGAPLLPYHNGPRGPLVLAAHITQATGKTRRQIIRALALGTAT